MVGAPARNIINKMIPNPTLPNSVLNPGLIVPLPRFPAHRGSHPLFATFSTLTHIDDIGSVAIHLLVEFKDATCCVAFELR